MNSVAIIDVSQHFIDTSISQILEALVKPAPLGESAAATAIGTESRQGGYPYSEGIISVEWTKRMESLI